MLIQMKAALKSRLPRCYRLARRLLHPTQPIPFGLWLVNAFFQRIVQLNGDVPWMVHFTSKVSGPKNIRIGRFVRTSFAMSGGCFIQAINGIEIGDHTIFAPHVCIISANHDPENLELHVKEPPIRIGRHCWIGANAVILPAVQLGDRTIVGAGAVVTKSFPADVVLAGVPARIIRQRNKLGSTSGTHCDQESFGG